jgi:cholesterol transport system auxiliary component
VTSSTRRPFVAAVFAIAIGVLPACGCALLSHGPTVDVRWFTPELAYAPAGHAEMQSGRELCLGRVTFGSAMGPRIAVGDGLYEVGYYDDRRWTERPEHYVRRALDRVLFEGGRFRRALTGAPLLDVDLLEFEEVKAPTVHAARVALHVVLSTDRVLLERTITVSEPAAGTFETFVAAMAMALQASTTEVARSVGEALDTAEPTSTPKD